MQTTQAFFMKKCSRDSGGKQLNTTYPFVSAKDPIQLMCSFITIFASSSRLLILRLLEHDAKYPLGRRVSWGEKRKRRSQKKNRFKETNFDLSCQEWKSTQIASFGFNISITRREITRHPFFGNCFESSSFRNFFLLKYGSGLKHSVSFLRPLFKIQNFCGKKFFGIFTENFFGRKS